ncbi:MAG TPA: aminotransferase class I/II-fold pyridoxal phosphate-dependent enzyme [Gaiellaceae bacterium]|jgi:8-amino-7-oxononanoate synthase
MSEALARFLADTLAEAGRAAWSTNPVVSASASPGRARIDGRERILLCTNDYLGLACDPRVVAAAADALSQYGFGSRAARSLAGDTDVHRALEQELADYKGTQAALTFGSGFSTNVGVIGALTTADDVICSDALNHASIVDGCRLSAARTAVYPHGDLDGLEVILRGASSAAKRMIVTDAVFSMDGDVAPLPQIVELADRYDAFVMLDEAHATGVLGPEGRGTLAHFDLHGSVPVLMGTLGKALGSVGGFVTGSRDLVDVLARKARSFLFTTAPPAAAAAAALEALRILRAEPERVQRLWDNARRLHGGLVELGFDLSPAPAPITPVFLHDDRVAADASRVLFDRGVVAHAIGTPYVPAGTARLRLISSAAHEPADVDAVLDAFAGLRPA